MINFPKEVGGDMDAVLFDRLLVIAREFYGYQGRNGGSVAMTTKVDTTTRAKNNKKFRTVVAAVFRRNLHRGPVKKKTAAGG